MSRALNLLVLVFLLLFLAPLVFASGDVVLWDSELPYSKVMNFSLSENGQVMGGFVINASPAFLSGSSFSFINSSIVSASLFVPSSTSYGVYSQGLFLNYSVCRNVSVSTELLVPNCTVVGNVTVCTNSTVVLNSSVLNCSVVLMDESFAVVVEPTPSPLKVLSVKPNYFEVGFDTVHFDVYLGDPRDTAYYLISQSFPSGGESDWVRMQQSNDKAFVDINFGNEPAGLLYVKLVGRNGSLSVTPTGVVSLASVKVVLDKNSKRVNPGDSVTIPLSVKRKRGSPDLLKFKFNNLTGDNDSIPVNHVSLSDDNQSFTATESWGGSIPFTGSVKDFFLHISVPPTVTLEEYVLRYFFALF